MEINKLKMLKINRKDKKVMKRTSSLKLSQIKLSISQINPKVLLKIQINDIKQ